MRLGKLEVKMWKDTGKPKFRVWKCVQGCTPVWPNPDPPIYRWMFKVMSYWTLWVARYN